MPTRFRVATDNKGWAVLKEEALEHGKPIVVATHIFVPDGAYLMRDDHWLKLDEPALLDQPVLRLFKGVFRPD